jgi:hypothetical protein
MKKLILLLLITLAASPFVILSARNRNVKCCHGCEGYYCKSSNCRNVCGNGPKCQGCWKDCK